jgi:mono/diheme cytochrome c family protein
VTEHARRYALLSLLVPALLWIGLPGVLRPQSTEVRERTVDRGRYLVNEVAMCVECHTPRDAEGNLERSRLLMGAPIPVPAPPFAERWAPRAPPLAGLDGWTDGQIVSLLSTGALPNGRRPNPPMPPFRLNEDDARAVVLYLRSLGGLGQLRQD